MIQIIVNSLFTGLTYGLIAAGFSVTFGISKIINFAHGEFYMFGAFGIYFACQVLGLNYFLGMIIVAMVIFGLGAICWKACFQRFVNQELLQFAVGGSMLFILSSAAAAIFGIQDRGLSSVFSGIITIKGVSLPRERLSLIVLSLLILGGVQVFLSKMKIGRALRAVSQDRLGSSLIGIDESFVSMVALGLGCMLAGLAGGIIAPVFVVSPFMGMHALLKAFIIVILGGMGSFLGAIAGGLIIGFIECFGYIYIGGFAETISYAVAILIILIRPRGLFGSALGVEQVR